MLLYSSFAKSDALIGLDYILFTDTNSVEANTSAVSSKSLYSFNVQFSINSKKNLRIGWAIYSVITNDDVNNQQSNYFTQDMGPSVRYEFGRSGLYYVNFVYGIQVKTTYDSGSTSETWLGTNYLAQAGVSPEISENFSVNFAFNFFSGSAIAKVVSTTQTDVAYAKAFMTPTVGLSYKW